jgi:hypothetical protein
MRSLCFQRYQHSSNRRRTRRAQLREARRSRWLRFVPRKSSRSRSESSFREEVARSRRRGSSRMYGARPRSWRPAERWWRLKRRQTADDGRQVARQRADGGSLAICPLFRLPSAVCRRRTTNGETGRSRFPRLLLKRPTSSSRPSSFQPFSWPFSWLPLFNLL